MGEKTGIGWTDSTFDPWIGCTNVSSGCDHCYAEADNKRRKWTEWGPHGERHRTTPAYWRNPIKWQKQAPAFEREHGRRRRVFCASLADVFDNQVPPEWRADLFALIRQCPEFDTQLLTKRPQNMAKMLPPDWGDGYPNVWLGTTAESQTYYDQRWPILARTPAIIRFVSYEPALGPLRLSAGPTPDWLICGGESGPGARMMAPQWARDIRDQCMAAGVQFFMKQMTKLVPIPEDLLVRGFPMSGFRHGLATPGKCYHP
jgi:protein gp37